MKEEHLPKYLISLACSQLILEHAQKDTPAQFAEHLKQDFNLPAEQAPEINQSPHKNADLQTNNNQDSNSKNPNTEPGQNPQKSKSPKKNRKHLLVAAGLFSTVLLTVSIFIYANLSLKNSLLPRTYYAGTKLNSNPEQALKQIEDLSNSYQIKLNYQNQQKTYPKEDLGLQIDTRKTLQQAKLKNTKIRFWQKPFYLFKSVQIDSATSVDRTKLKQFLEANQYGDKVPEDAKLEFSEQANQFNIIPEVAGRGINYTSLAEELRARSLKLNSAPINLAIEDVQPSIQAANLASIQQEANSFINQTITIQAPEKIYKTTPKIKKDWLTLTAKPEQSTIAISLNQTSQQQYFKSILDKTNRKAEDRIYATVDNQELEVDPGSPGISVTNTDVALADFLSLVSSRKSGSVKFEYTQQQQGSKNVANTSGRWIFADISKFRIYAYEGSSRLKEFAMSSGKASTPTPPGSYSVLRKVRVKTMTSGGSPNSPDYYSVPNIEWVAYFKSGGYAMHGVYWHNKFGIENTSHGCMGMSNADAHWIYDFVDIGTPVIIIP